MILFNCDSQFVREFPSMIYLQMKILDLIENSFMIIKQRINFKVNKEHKKNLNLFIKMHTMNALYNVKTMNFPQLMMIEKRIKLM